MPPLTARLVFQVSVVAIMLFQVAALFARSMLELSLMDDGLTRAVARDLSYLVVPPILLALMWPYLKRCKAGLLGLLRPSDVTSRLVVLSILLGLTLRVTYWSGLTVLIWAGVAKNEDANALVGPVLAFDCPSMPVILLSLGVVAFFIPIIEEVINRGFILHALLPRGAAVSVLVSALLFASMHPPSSYFLTFCAGIFFAVQTLNYGTLWASLIAHAAYNALTVLDWECFQIAWNPQASDPDLARLAIIAMPVAVAGICLAVFIVSRKAAGNSEAPRRL